MTSSVPQPVSEPVEMASPDYLAWKDAKVRRALDQSRDRSIMIPADEVWKELGLED